MEKRSNSKIIKWIMGFILAYDSFLLFKVWSLVVLLISIAVIKQSWNDYRLYVYLLIVIIALGLNIWLICEDIRLIRKYVKGDKSRGKP
jgi:hypothetical protein